jgi:hypothetical protein
MPKISNPLGAVDQKIINILGDGPVTAAQVRAAHKQAFGTDEGASRCVVRFDRAGRLVTASGELGSRGRAAAGLAPAERAPRVSRDPVTEELARLRRRYPNASETTLRELAAEKAPPPREPRPPRAPLDPLRKTDPAIRDLIEEATDHREHPIGRDELRLLHEAVRGDRPSEPGPARDEWDEDFDRCIPRLKRAHLLVAGRAKRVAGEATPHRKPRTPSDPLRKTDPRVREMLVEATSEGPIDRSGLRLIHERVNGPRPEAPGVARDAWDKSFENCVPRVKRAGLLETTKRGSGPKSGPRRGAGNLEDELRKADAKVMREVRGELSCLRKHALGVARLDAEACPIGRSKAEGDALRASKTAAVKQLDQLWASAMKSDSPLDAIRILDEAAKLVADKFPGNRFGYEVKAAGVLAAALGASAPIAAE